MTLGAPLATVSTRLLTAGEFYDFVQRRCAMFASMEEAMAAARAMREVIAAELAAEPFVPFRLSLTGRSVYEVQRPEQVRLGEYVAKIGHPDAGEPDGFRVRAVLALEHVVSLSPIVPDEPLTLPGGEQAGEAPH
jgi:hypothetical protein